MQYGYVNNSLDVDVNLVGLALTNTVLLDQVSLNGYNSAVISAEATTGSNVLGAGTSTGLLWSFSPATQISAGSYNNFYWTASGGNNQFGLTQNATEENIANAVQYGGGNTLVAYQFTSNGSNSLTATQAGGMTATVNQHAAAGNNIVTISQL